MPEIVEGLVTTIIPVYNRPQMLLEAVQSVLNQTYRPIEVVISDDGSTDSAGQVADELAAANPDTIRVVHNPNRGAGPARESGRQLARGEFVQYLDSDDLLLPSKFDIMVKALRDHPECGAAYGYIRFCPEDGPPKPEPYKWSGRRLPTLFPWLLVDRWWNTDCPLFRRSVCDEVGPWTDLRYSQDWEYDGRVGALGTKLVHCREFVCEQRHHAGLRQTGSGKWLAPEQQVRFFRLLHCHALRAGVSIDQREMRHFSRWVFSQARVCGLAGDSQSADALLGLAWQSAEEPDVSLRLVRRLAAVLGWRVTGKLCQLRDRLSGAHIGTDSQRLSWMEP